MKKKYLLLNILSIMIIGLLFTMNVETVIAKSKLKISSTKKEVNMSKSFSLSVKGTKKKVKWSSSDKKIAAVKSVGKTKCKVIAHKEPGEAIISAKVNGKTLKCKVTVLSNDKRRITKSEAKKILDDTYNQFVNFAYYNTRIVGGGDSVNKNTKLYIPLNDYIRTQTASRLCRTYPVTVSQLKKLKFKNFTYSSDYESGEMFEDQYKMIDKSELKSHMKDLFGTTKIKLYSEPIQYNLSYYNNEDAFTQDGKIFIEPSTGNSDTGKKNTYYRNVKINKKTNQVKFDLMQKSPTPGRMATLTITLKSSDSSKYGYIIKSLKTNYYNKVLILWPDYPDYH